MPEPIVKVDALFEGTLALLLLGGAATGALGADDFPSPVGEAVLVAVGVLLVAVAAVLWRLGTRATPAPTLRLLGLTNGAGAALVLAWLLAASGFSPAGAAVAGATLGALAVVAAAQLYAGRGSVQ